MASPGRLYCRTNLLCSGITFHDYHHWHPVWCPTLEIWCFFSFPFWQAGCERAQRLRMPEHFYECAMVCTWLVGDCCDPLDIRDHLLYHHNRHPVWRPAFQNGTSVNISVWKANTNIIKQKRMASRSSFFVLQSNRYYQRSSEDTVSFLRPCARRAARTRRPFGVLIRSRKPCLLTLLRFEG